MKDTKMQQNQRHHIFLHFKELFFMPASGAYNTHNASC